MAATTISRATWTNDTGTAASPNLDGTVLNNARLQADVYDKIDALFTANFTFGALLNAEGFGTHSFWGGGAGSQILSLRNTTAGATNGTELRLGNDATALSGRIVVHSSTFTTAGPHTASGLLLEAVEAGGLTLAASDASGNIRVYANGSTLVGTMLYASAGGVLRMVSSGVVTAPTYSFDGDTDTGIYRAGADQIGITCGGTAQFTLRNPISTIGHAFNVLDAAIGAGSFAGPGITIGRNSSGGGAAGWLLMTRKSGTVHYLWVDDAGNLEIATSPPQEDGSPSDTSGTVVGTQASTLESKELLGGTLEPAAALDVIVRTPIRHFKYRQGDDRTEFYGIIAEDSPMFAMHATPDHPHGRSFNPINAHGYTVQAIKALEARIAVLEGQAL